MSCEAPSLEHPGFGRRETLENLTARFRQPGDHFHMGGFRSTALRPCLSTGLLLSARFFGKVRKKNGSDSSRPANTNHDVIFGGLAVLAGFTTLDP
jgi:hypothetical protein